MKPIKRIITIALLFVMCSSVISQTPTTSLAKIQFDDIKHTFPPVEILTSSTNQNAITTLASGKPAILTHTFTFINTGQAPLVIHRVTALCDCTTVEYTKEPIMPGKQGQLKITYNGTGKHPGRFSKAVTVYTNATPETHRLFFDGEMKVKESKIH